MCIKRFAVLSALVAHSVTAQCGADPCRRFWSSLATSLDFVLSQGVVAGMCAWVLSLLCVSSMARYCQVLVCSRIILYNVTNHGGQADRIVDSFGK